MPPINRSNILWLAIHGSLTKCNCVLRMHRECRERFPRHRRLTIPTCITALAWRTCRESCRVANYRFPLKWVAGKKTIPEFTAHAQPAILRIWKEAHSSPWEVEWIPRGKYAAMWLSLQTWQVRGHSNWHMGLPALLGNNLGCWTFLIPPYIAQFMGCVIGRIHYGLKVVFCFRHFTAYHYNHEARVLTSIENL